MFALTADQTNYLGLEKTLEIDCLAISSEATPPSFVELTNLIDFEIGLQKQQASNITQKDVGSNSFAQR